MQCITSARSGNGPKSHRSLDLATADAGREIEYVGLMKSLNALKPSNALLRTAVALLACVVLIQCTRYPNQAFVQACSTERNWRHATVTTSAVIEAEGNLLNFQRDTSCDDGNPACISNRDPCYDCVTLLRQGFQTVEYLRAQAANPDQVYRYSLERAGDPRCGAFDRRGLARPPRGKCVAIETNVRRSARYGISWFGGDPSRDIQASMFEAVDLQERRVLARAVEFNQGGGDGPRYSCADVGFDRGDGRTFVRQSIRPDV